jgi:hypothetical protein
MSSIIPPTLLAYVFPASMMGEPVGKVYPFASFATDSALAYVVPARLVTGRGLLAKGHP